MEIAKAKKNNTLDFTEAFRAVRHASRNLLLMDTDKINQVLHAVADRVEEEIPHLLEENQKDLDRMDEDNPKYDRLLLNEDRIKSIASDIRNVSSMDDPTGKTLQEHSVDSGLHIKRMSVPLGVVGIIYEARPNVTLDVFSLCIKSRNACVLKGGSDAEFSNKAIVALIQEVLKENDVNPNIVHLMPSEREATGEMLNAVGHIDILIPRGGRGLIDFVRDNAKIPVIETGAGICHTYVDKDAELDKAVAIVNNAKTRRVSVCNALDCMVLHQDQVDNLPAFGTELAKSEVGIYADEPAYEALNGHYPENLLHKADAEHFGMEFLDYKMSIKTVGSFDEAMNYVQEHTSMHSESIVTENQEAAERFLKAVDAAAVYHNTSTAFTDGAEFGLGAEIGISTQKLHARGPMGLDELCTYKWVVSSQGVTRP